MAEFQWWLLLLGLVAGGGIVGAVYLDSARRDQDIEDRELPAEAAWIGDRLRTSGHSVKDQTVAQVLIEYRAYRAEPPPDRLTLDEPTALDRAGRADRTDRNLEAGEGS